ncbi:hypothetical protein GO001_29230 [Streptomyces sp. NRRL B-1677]|uniref:hypothetical protein n=1 Tax=Streptomyces sp. NRRL B-1677 TaxID=2682966 RepID=UPI001892BA5A|nr:hypothetical protein [Streptomyces sp. NRRL B-1677]MBF6049225.1 hypothetical protein [Streptomyces sp. NRRL B-1677]
MNDLTTQAQADAAAQTRSTDDRDERGGRSLILPAVLAVLLIPVALLFGGLAPMATDSCGPDHCSRALDQALAEVVFGLYATFAGTPALLLTTGVLPRRMRYATARRLTAWSALLPPAFVILRVLALPQ